MFITHNLFITLVSWHRFGTGNAATILSYLLGNHKYLFLWALQGGMLQTRYIRMTPHYSPPHLLKNAIYSHSSMM